MIIPKWMPVVTIADIKRELEEKGVDREHTRTLRHLMFGDRFMNDVYISYRIADDAYAKDCDDKEKAKVKQMIIDILRETCPDSEKVLVDVSW